MYTFCIGLKPYINLNVCDAEEMNLLILLIFFFYSCLLSFTARVSFLLISRGSSIRSEPVELTIRGKSVIETSGDIKKITNSVTYVEIENEILIPVVFYDIQFN